MDKEIKRIITEKKAEFHKKYIKTPEFESVRQAVFERDHHKCVLCGRTENLVCHHTSYRHLGYHNQKEIDDCVTLCQNDHLNHHRGKYNLGWYSIDHPRNNDDLREVKVEGQRILVRSNGKDFYDGVTYKRLKVYYNKDRDKYTTSINHKNIYVHRIVAKAFPEICGEWFEDCEVHHIDRDCSNNKAENLRILSQKEHREEHREDMSKIWSEINSVPVYQYSLSGNYIATWKSTMEAAKKLGLNRSAIENSICGFSVTSGDYIWKHFEEGEEIPLFIEPVKTGKERAIEKNSVPVLQYSLDGEFIKEWKNATDACIELNGKRSGSIQNCLKGRSKSAFGYVWKYKK